MTSLGFRSNHYTYYNTFQESTFEVMGGAEFLGIFQMDMDKVVHSRSIYTVWDFFGDVGGLFDMLKLLA